MSHALHPATGRCLGCGVAGVDPASDCAGEYGTLGNSTRYILSTDGRLALRAGRGKDETILRLTPAETSALRGLLKPRNLTGGPEFGDE